MIIAESQKYIFIHIPKTGGTSVSVSFDPHLKYNDIILGGSKYGERIQQLYKKRFTLHKHSKTYEVIEVIGKDNWSRYFTFAIVRNPYKRLISSYTYTENKLTQAFGPGIQKDRKTKDWQTLISWFKLWSKKHLSKEQFWLFKWETCQAYLETNNFSEFIRHPTFINFYQTQWSWLSDPSGQNQLVDRIIKLEDLAKEWPDLCDKVNTVAELVHSNRSASKKIFPTPEDLDHIYELVKVDFERLNYGREEF